MGGDCWSSHVENSVIETTFLVRLSEIRATQTMCRRLLITDDIQKYLLNMNHSTLNPALIVP